MHLNKAVFLSLDGTIVKTKSGREFPRDSKDWEFISTVLPKLKYLGDKGYIPCIVCNQGGIGSGKVAESEVSDRLMTIEKELEQWLGINVNTAYAPNLESYYRKPNPGMAYYLAIELHLSLRDSIMIGSTKIDSYFAKNAYIGTYYDVEDFINTDLSINDRI